MYSDFCLTHLKESKAPTDKAVVGREGEKYVVISVLIVCKQETKFNFFLLFITFLQTANPVHNRMLSSAMNHKILLVAMANMQLKHMSQ